MSKSVFPFLICLCRYALEVIKIPGVIKEALKKLKSSHPQITAIFMGTRRTDPKAGASYLWHVFGGGMGGEGRGGMEESLAGPFESSDLKAEC